MATYVVGDVHGCYRTFRALMERIDFAPGRDQLWLVGDLVNGGLNSVEVLRWALQHDDCVTCVLGNHDIYALARYWGAVQPKKRDTLQALLGAPDAEALMQWLRRRPIIHQQGRQLLVHAGLSPLWSVSEAVGLAREIEGCLRGSHAIAFLRRYFASPKRGWKPGSGGEEAWIRGLRMLTMLRTCQPSGKPCFEFTGPPEEAPSGCVPWYELRPPGEPTIYFGHWAALGFRKLPNAVGLDSGCVWGNALSAIRLEDDQLFQVRCRE